MQERPSHADSLDEVLTAALRLLSRGVSDRRSAFHVPTLATADAAGLPRLRTVVLRNFDPALRCLTIHTDRRSAKIPEIRNRPRVALHVYDRSASLQLRLDGIAEIHVDDAVARNAWTHTAATSRLVYALQPPPGTPVQAPSDVVEDQDTGAANFAVLQIIFDRLEWLWLSREGHRRAALSWNDAGERHATWLAP